MRTAHAFEKKEYSGYKQTRTIIHHDRNAGAAAFDKTLHRLAVLIFESPFFEFLNVAEIIFTLHIADPEAAGSIEETG